MREADEPKNSARLQPRRKGRLKRVALSTLGLYGLVVIVLSGCANMLLLHPSVQAVRDVPGKPISIYGPSGKLDVWTIRSHGAAEREPQAYYLAFVGNASRAEYDVETAAEQWDQVPVEIWAVNYPGFGQSEGKAKLSALAPAALAAFDALAQKAGGRPIFVGGRSIGTAVALYVAAHRPVAGVILHSPTPLRQLIIGRFGWWNLWLGAIPIALAVPADLDSIENARRVTAPAVFLITAADTLVPPSYQQHIVAAYQGPKTSIIMAGVNHNHAIPETEIAKLRAALENLLPAPAAH